MTCMGSPLVPFEMILWVDVNPNAGFWVRINRPCHQPSNHQHTQIYIYII